MKKTFIFGFMGIMTVMGANAAFQPAPTSDVLNSGGYVGDENIITVFQAADMRDDTDVIMVGRLTGQIGDEKYTFEDATGRMTVEIDDDEWKELIVTPADTIKIYGEIDRDGNGIIIDVDTIQKL